MTDTEKDALCTRIDELCAELGKTQLSLDKWHDRAEDMRNRLLAAHAENAKLKKLVREIWRSCPVSEDDCAKCPHYIVESDEVWCDIPILMEQLGVLVNE